MEITAVMATTAAIKRRLNGGYQNGTDRDDRWNRHDRDDRRDRDDRNRDDHNRDGHWNRGRGNDANGTSAARPPRHNDHDNDGNHR